jgi:hypothetical protein
MVRPEDDMRPRNFRKPPCEITSIHFEKENTLDFGDQLVYTLENILRSASLINSKERLAGTLDGGDIPALPWKVKTLSACPENIYFMV